MSKATSDFRVAITPEIDVWLETESRISGRTRQEIAREALHQLAVRELAKYRLGVSLAGTNGLLTASGGIATESHGTRRRDRSQG